MTAPQNVNTSPLPSSKPMIKPALSTINGKPILRERFYDALDAEKQPSDDQLSQEDADLLTLMKKSTEPVSTSFGTSYGNPLEVKFYKPTQK